MDEMNKNEELETGKPSEEEKEEVSLKEASAGEPSQESQSGRSGFAPTKRNLMLWLVCGFYLAYNGYHLVKGYVTHEEGTNLIFLLCGIAFIGIGGFLVFSSYRLVTKMDQAKKEQEAGENPEGGENQEGQAGSFGGSLLGGLFGSGARGGHSAQETAEKKPSIAERARLAKDLGDVNESEGDTDGGN